MAKNVVESCIAIYKTISAQLLPTPVKSHYTFNLRDLSKTFQGMLMAEAKSIPVNMKSTRNLYVYFGFKLKLLLIIYRA